MLLTRTRAAAVSVNHGFSNTSFGPKTFQIGDGGPQGATGGQGVQVYILGGNTDSVFCVVFRTFNTNNGKRFFLSHAQFFQFFEMLTQPARRAKLQVIHMRRSPSSHNRAILSKVNVAVDVAMVVGESVPLAFRGALLSGGTCLVLLIYHKLDPLFTARLGRSK